MKVFFSHPTGNANVRAATYGLAKADMLSVFHTAIASFPGDILFKLGALGPFADIRRRNFDPALKGFTQMWPWIEIGRLMASKAGLSGLTKHETGFFCIDAVYRSLDRRTAKSLRHASLSGVNAVYAYEDGASYSFREAKHLGLQCLYDLPIGYWRTAQQLLETEQNRWPEWASTVKGFLNSEAKLAQKDEELRLADHIFVASQFTANTLQNFPGTLAPVEVIPYGFPPVGNKRDYPKISTKPLKLLFVGGLSQRKGIADLFAAVDGFGHHIELTVVGRKVSNNCPALDAALAKHRWIPSLPHFEVLKLMRAHDVLIFPSLFEGFGLVITEAMSQGTPVITTERTAGPDLIEHGHNGWLVEAGEVLVLKAAIEELLYHPELIADAGRAAIETARQRPWTVYGQELTAAIAKHLCVQNKII